MKIAIVFFSGTGITKRYAKIIATTLEHEGEYVKLHDITTVIARKNSIDFELYDAIIFGFPVYAGRLPTVAEEWLTTLDVKKHCSMYFTYGGRELEWAYQTGYYLLSKAKFTVLLGAEFLGKHSFNVAKGWDLASDRPNSQDILIAKEFTRESLKRFQNSNSTWDYDISEFDYKPRYTQEHHGPFAVFFPFKSQDCRMCYRCEKECPTIAFNLELGRAVNGVCIRCMHCVTICPDKVIKVGDATELYQKFQANHDLTLVNVRNKKSKIIF